MPIYMKAPDGIRPGTLMGRKEGYAEAVSDLLDDFLRTTDDRKIREYLAANSNLPGPRGNLELAHAFADEAGACSVAEPERIWDLVSNLSAVPPSEAPVNDPKELIPFSGTVAAGAIGAVREEYEKKAFALLKRTASDPRWRTREGVAMGLQRMIRRNGLSVLKELDGWVAGDRWMAMRAVAAGVAEPPLLKDPHIAKGALELHKKIVARVLASDSRRTEEFRTLRQALGYSLSVVMVACPKEGLDYLRELAGSYDPDVRWIVKENLKKNRLVKSFPRETEELKASR